MHTARVRSIGPVPREVLMTPSFMPPARLLTTLPAQVRRYRPTVPLLQTTAPSEVKRVLRGSASATISGGPGTDLVSPGGKPQ